MWQISLSKKLLNLKNLVLMRKVDTDLLPCQLMQVYSPLTSTWIVVRCTTGAHADTLKSVLSAMVNANGSWLDADPYNSMSQSQATTSSATANFQQTHHSAMVLTSTWSNGCTISTEVSGDSGELFLSGVASATGLSPSTSEESRNRNAKQIFGINTLVQRQLLPMQAGILSPWASKRSA
jgi:hypothetical protein